MALMMHMTIGKKQVVLKKLNKIKYKTYIIISQNDPICISKYSYFSEGQYKVNNNVNLYVSKFGGHSSFFSGFFC